jgi:hypothetical protein
MAATAATRYGGFFFSGNVFFFFVYSIKKNCKKNLGPRAINKYIYNVIIWSKCYHLGQNVIIWDEMLSSGMPYYHLELMISSGANVIIWDEMLSSGTKCYHLG